MNRLFAKFKEVLPWLVIGLVFGWAAISIVLRHQERVDSATTVIRIAHWQLEPGVRDGLAEAASVYEKLHPNVRVIQEAIPESTYGQWLSTQLMGGTAPDIIEVGMLDGAMMNAFLNRYFLPLSGHVLQSNPYNAGTPLAGQPLYRTFKDGMIHSFVPEVQQFMTIPLGLGSTRLFYNKTLLKKLTGLDAAPGNLRAFLAACEKIRAQKQPNGQAYIAITGSQFHFVRLEDTMAKPLTYLALRKIDFNRDGRFSNDEMFLGFATGKIDFNDPAYRACFKMVDTLMPELPAGWTGLSRDEALFNFAQGKAVFVPTGVYEAQAIESMGTGKFEVGVVDFPTPASDDPDFGKFFLGTRYEDMAGEMPMGVTRSSPHPDQAVDFLLFLASLRENERFNERLKWVPIVIGARLDPFLDVFEPNLIGPFSAFDPNIYAESSIKWSQLYTLHQAGQITYDEMARQFTDFYLSKGREDFAEFLRNRRRQQLRDQQLAVGLRQKALGSVGAESRGAWTKYREIIVGRQLDGDRMLAYEGLIFTDPDALKRESFYQFTPQALKNIARNARSATVAQKEVP